MPLRARMSSERGFTLIETMVAALILLIGISGMVLLYTTAAKTTLRNREREGGLALSRDVLESVRTISYDNLNAAQILPKLKTQPGLADSSGGSGYTIKRRGTVYTVSADVCSYDDPSDSSGPHDGGGFCQDSPGTNSNGTLDYGSGSGDGTIALGGGTPDDYKRVVVTISWKSGKFTRTIKSRTIIENPGNSVGPTITKLTTPSQTITADQTDVTFTATISSAPALLNWTVDGTTASSVQNPGTSYSWSWPISTLVDGPYEIGAQAFDSAGLSGSPRRLTMTLNRFVPKKPTGLKAGRNGNVVELEWLANPEKDISGYRVYRVASDGSLTQVCPSSGTTPLDAFACQDLNPPASGAVDYKVVAVDRNPSGAYREGTYSDVATAIDGNTAPNPPTGLLATTSGATTILRWTAPATPDPDAGDSIAFYRIYRDGITYADRYDRTGTGADVAYTDSATDGKSHTYSVTAVDNHLAESTVLGPVTK